MQQVFLSCVSRQFANNRQTLKAQFADANVALRIQEDFAEEASPFGTLIKLYHYLKQANLVVQLIGSIQPEPVRYPMVEELLRIDPKFRQWLVRVGLFVDLQSGMLGYTDFEAYLAIYLQKPFVALRIGNGTQSHHEDRLRALGKHVSLNVSKLDEILSHVQKALERTVNPSLSPSKKSWFSNAGLWAFAMLAIPLVALLQTIAVVDLENAGRAIWLRQLAAFLILAVLYPAVHLAAMTDRVHFEFRLKASLRNGFSWMLAAAVIGLALSLSDDLSRWLDSDWVSLALSALVLTIAGELICQWQTRTSARQLIWRLLLSFPRLLLMICIPVWLDWQLTWLYWFAHLITLAGMAYLVRADSQSFERWYDFGSSDLSDGIEQWEDAYFWYPRDQVTAEVKGDGFRRLQPRPPSG